MKVKQLELFKETDFDETKTFIKKCDGWYLFDNIRNRKDFSCNASNRYRAVCHIGKGIYGIYDNESYEARVTLSDEQANLIGMSDYLKLAYSMRLNGNYIYNKRKCKLELKNGNG
jgi:plasmid maintenance system killer protein